MENIFNNKEVSVKWDENCGKRGNENAEKELFLQIPIMRIRKRSEEREREEQQQIIEIIRHLVNNNNYIVHGYWLCEKKHEWKIQYTNDILRKYLEIPKIMYSFFLEAL